MNFLGNLKNINYDTQNIEKFKDSTTNELFGALGFLSEINFEKEQKIRFKYLLQSYFYDTPLEV